MSIKSKWQRLKEWNQYERTVPMYMEATTRNLRDAYIFLLFFALIGFLGSLGAETSGFFPEPFDTVASAFLMFIMIVSIYATQRDLNWIRKHMTNRKE